MGQIRANPGDHQVPETIDVSHEDLYPSEESNQYEFASEEQTFPRKTQQPVPPSSPVTKPHAFPPEPDFFEPHNFPSDQSLPHAFPPEPDFFEPHNLPQAQPNHQDFSPTPIKPQAFPPNVVGPQWTTELFGCMEDPTNALLTACFPCVTFGQIAEIVDSGQTTCATSGLIYGTIALLIAMPCLMSCTYRTKLRNQYGLIESPASDWLIHCFCECCALCQEYRELQRRGLEPSIGWQGNQALKMKMQLKQATLVPPVHQTMMG